MIHRRIRIIFSLFFRINCRNANNKKTYTKTQEPQKIMTKNKEFVLEQIMATRSILNVLTLFFFTSIAIACIWSVNNGEFKSVCMWGYENEQKNLRFDLSACWIVMRLHHIIFLLVGAFNRSKQSRVPKPKGNLSQI